MRISKIGWAIIVLALTASVWSFMEYQRQMIVPDDLIASNPPAVLRRLVRERRGNVAPQYIEREILIIGAAVAAWLFTNRRTKA
jgi:hypothetical protein